MASLWESQVWHNCATLTPVDGSGTIDDRRLAAHCTWLAETGFNSVTLFGTTGEGPAFTPRERLRATEALMRLGYPAQRIILGIGSAALGDMVELAKGARRLGLAGVLATPPFYFRDATEDGLFVAYATLVERAGQDCPPMLLYHIPSFTGLSLGAGMVDRLANAFPGVIRGVKDSGGDFDHTLRLLERLPGLTILSGTERHLPELMTRGCKGTICGWANIAPQAIRRLLAGDTGALGELRDLERLIEGRPFLPVFKALVAERLGDLGWRPVLPPQMAIAGPIARASAAA
jgi:4-hydroxy-tetrahydrodipicolinate synthase